MALVDLGNGKVGSELRGRRCTECERVFWIASEHEDEELPEGCPWCGEHDDF